MNNKNFIIAILILVAAVFVGIKATRPLKAAKGEPAAKMSDFPMTVGGWQGEDMPLEERDYEILGTKNLIMREYKNLNADSVYLYIIYSEENRRTMHPPEICYSGGGASTITKKSVIPVTDSIKANKFIIEYKDSRQLVVYWFKSAELSTDSYLRQQLKFVADRTLGKRTSGAMVRVSTVVKEGGQEAAFELIKKFCAEIEPLLAKYVP